MSFNNIPLPLGKHIFVVTMLTLSALFSTAQTTTWDNLPKLPTTCYSENDPFVEALQAKRYEVKEELDTKKQKAEERAMQISDKEKMDMAMRYQKMSPDEIIKMQQEMAEMSALMMTFQQLSTEMEDRYNTLEADYQTEFENKLGRIEQEHRALPDGEGTPDWAIKKGNELMAQYKKEYELLCANYFSTEGSLFQEWLREYKAFLIEHETPFNKAQISMQYKQFNLEPDLSTASLMAIDKYLDKCSQIFGLRKSYL